MDSEAILSWNFANWVTVVLMVAVFYFGITAASKFYSAKKAA